MSTYVVPRISVNRIRASRLRDEGTAASLHQSVFHQLYQQMRGTDANSYKYLQVDQLPWNVQFAGEGSIDVGGPGREAFSTLGADLMSNATDLFILSPNGVNGVGLNRSTYLPSPSAVSSRSLSQLEWLGNMFGVALRTRQPLSLDLPPLVWKSLLDHPLDVSDLEAFDKLCSTLR